MVDKVAGIEKALKAADITAEVKTAKEAELTAAKAEVEVKNAAVKPAPFKMKNPGVFSMGLSFLLGILVSLMKREQTAEEMFESEKVRTYVGIGAEGASKH